MTRPPFDPWLAGRPRDRRGLPVPYVNMWGDEREVPSRIEFDPLVGERAVFIDDEQSVRVPDFTRQNAGRQRRCMVEGLCQVCARPVPWSRRCLIVSGASVQWVQVGGRQLPVVYEPWLDERCADIATAWCPALIRQERAGNLHRVPVRSTREVSLVMSHGWVDGHPDTVDNHVVIFVKVALRHLQILR